MDSSAPRSFSPLHILTNFERFPCSWTTRAGLAGSAQVLPAGSRFLAQAPTASLILLNGNPDFLYRLALRSLLPGFRVPIVAVDLVLRRPSTFSAHAAARLKRLLLRRVAHFIHYFRSSPGYATYFGIGPGRSSFVPFKPNISYHWDPQRSPEGQYILCFGRSLRDYDTFFSAVATLPYPAAIPTPDLAALRQHGSRFSWPLHALPPNVTLLPDDGSPSSMLRLLENARLLVLPILADSLLAANSVYLNAMRMHKCVIVSEGPGVSDVLTAGQALLVPPEDPAALARQIRLAWEDAGLRRATAQTGYRYALSLGGEADLYLRILEALAAWWTGPHGPARAQSK